MSDNQYRRKNNCPYCGYFCDAATMIDDPKAVPTPGDISFCLMCSESAMFDQALKLVKFDLMTIEDKRERNRLLGMQKMMHQFWETHPNLRGNERKECLEKARISKAN